MFERIRGNARICEGVGYKDLVNASPILRERLRLPPPCTITTSSEVPLSVAPPLEYMAGNGWELPGKPNLTTRR